MLIKKMLPKQRALRANHIPLRKFHEKRNTVLLSRNARGIGDILMCRMMFEDFKRVMPDMKLVFACPPEYHCLVKDHPFLDGVENSVIINREDYLLFYDISQVCMRWECGHAPNADKHRADIWAEYCGVILTRHNMFLPFISNETIQDGLLQVCQARKMAPKVFDENAPSVLFTPMTNDMYRTLTDEQIKGVVNHLRQRGCFVYSTHHIDIPLFADLDVPVLSGYNMEQWISFIHAADYVVTADTSVFHYAGGIAKPMTGIFTHADGKYRGKYFDFVLVQKHRDNGDWPCGPCYNHANCTHPAQKNGKPKPCLTELTVGEMVDGMEKMFTKWHK